jgi:putative ABC transport system permease protein
MTGSVTVPGKKREFKAPVKLYGSGDDKLVTLRMNSMDYEFIEAFEMDLIACRAFSEQFFNDPDTSLILSESAVKILGFKDPEDIIGQTLSMPQFQWNAIVVGVVNDYNQESLQKKTDPMMFYCSPTNAEFFSMKINTGDLSNTIAGVESKWNEAFPGNPFQYFFLDDYFNRQYENEQKFGDLFMSFSILAIIIGCLGLFGLSAFTTQQRTKEVGIRKVLGSSIPQIFLLLSKEYVWLIVASVAIASPLVYWVMDDWISNFAYQTSIGLAVFLVAGFAVLMVAIITISYQSLKAARTNPIESLRYE